MIYQDIQKAIDTRTFNIGDAVHRVCKLVSQGSIQEARDAFHNEFVPPVGYSEAILPITLAEYGYIRSVEESNKGVEIHVFHTKHNESIKEV
jgi:hypothetical protein